MSKAPSQKVRHARDLYDLGYGVQAIARKMNESPHLVAQWVRVRKEKHEDAKRNINKSR